jgi:hypothetical protein
MHPTSRDVAGFSTVAFPLCGSAMIRGCAIILGCATMLGCAGNPDNRPRRVPVTGTVLYNGQPVADATVLFEPVGDMPAAAGRTDGQGRFQLETFSPGDGGVPGDYKITVRKVEVIRGQKGEPVSDDYVGPPPDEKWLLPIKYSKAETSGLAATVREGRTNDIKLELQDEQR